MRVASGALSQQTNNAVNRCLEFHSIVPKSMNLNHRAINANGCPFKSSATLWMPQLNVPLEPAMLVRMLRRAAWNAVSDLDATQERPKIETRKRCGYFRRKRRCAVFMVIVTAACAIPQAMPFCVVM
jgi:hypothetical protein